MTYLIQQMIVCLSATALIFFVLGWLAARLRAARLYAEAQAHVEYLESNLAEQQQIMHNLMESLASEVGASAELRTECQRLREQRTKDLQMSAASGS